MNESQTDVRVRRTWPGRPASHRSWVGAFVAHGLMLAACGAPATRPEAARPATAQIAPRSESVPAPPITREEIAPPARFVGAAIAVPDGIAIEACADETCADGRRLEPGIVRLPPGLVRLRCGGTIVGMQSHPAAIGIALADADADGLPDHDGIEPVATWIPIRNKSCDYPGSQSVRSVLRRRCAGSSRSR